MPVGKSPTQQVLEIVEQVRAGLKQCTVTAPVDQPSMVDDIMDALLGARHILIRQHEANRARKAGRSVQSN